MKKRKRKIDKRLRNIFGIVCLSFFIGTLLGAVAGNLLYERAQEDLYAFLQKTLVYDGEVRFSVIFLKYLKYDLLIWLGGWISLGLFLSGAVFFLRSVLVGMASAIMMRIYGAKGILTAVTGFLPQNLILIPTYLFMMVAALYYFYAWQDGSGKGSLKRERRRKQTEYCILFLLSMIFLAAAAGVERLILQM